MRFRGQGAVAPAGAKFSVWASMADLARLVLRSGAPRLGLRLGAALGLVFLGKVAGVWSPVVFGDAINRIHPRDPASLGPFALAAVATAALSLAAAGAPFARDAIFMRVSQATMAKAAVESFQHALGLSLDF